MLLVNLACQVLRVLIRVWFAVGILPSASWIGAVPLLALGLFGPTPGSGCAGQAWRPGEIVAPGFALQLEDAGPWALAVALVLGVHEAGHALAAAAYGVRMIGLSFWGLGMAVRVDQVQLRSLSRWKRVAIAVAGIWHNIVLCGVIQLLCFAQSCCVHSNAQLGGGATVWRAAGDLQAGTVIARLNGRAIWNAAGLAYAINHGNAEYWNTDEKRGKICANVHLLRWDSKTVSIALDHQSAVSLFAQSEASDFHLSGILGKIPSGLSRLLLSLQSKYLSMVFTLSLSVAFFNALPARGSDARFAWTCIVPSDRAIVKKFPCWALLDASSLAIIAAMLAKNTTCNS